MGLSLGRLACLKPKAPHAEIPAPYTNIQVSNIMKLTTAWVLPIFLVVF
jgi:hypothetical protein